MIGAVVDASVWVSRMVPGDVHHARCRAWFDEQTSGGGLLVAPAFMLAEIAGAISRQTGRPRLAHQALAVLQRLGSLRLVSVDPILAKLAAELAGDHALRGADAIYVATARQLKLPLITLDGEQLDRAQAAVTAISP